MCGSKVFLCVFASIIAFNRELFNLFCSQPGSLIISNISKNFRVSCIFFEKKTFF